jgi:hypothetical protein
MKEHCALVNEKGKVSIEPLEHATILVNGKPIPTSAAMPLESGFRIIIDWHVFRFSSPQSVRAQRMRESASFSNALADMLPEGTEASDYGKDSGVNNIVDWTFARKEALSRLTLRGDDLDMLGDEELDGLFQDITRARTSRRRPESQAGTPSRLRAIQNIDRLRSPERSTPTSVAENPWDDDLSDRDLQMAPAAIDPASRQMQAYSEMASATGLDEDVAGSRRQPSRAESNLQMDRMAEEIRLLRQVALQNRFESLSTRLSGVLLDREKEVAQQAIRQWRRVRLVAMANAMRDQATSVEEANRLADQYGIGTAYRLVASRGSPASTMETHVESILFDAEATHSVTRSTGDVAILVIDKQRKVAYVWSIEKLQRQLPSMRSYGADLDLAHRSPPETTFRTIPCPAWTHLGTAMFALHPRIEAAMQVPIQSFETAEAVGNVTVHVTWDSSSDSLTSGSRSASITLHNVRAFAEGISSVHMQLRLPTFGIGGKRENLRSSEVVDLTNASTAHLKLKETFSLDIAAYDPALYIQVDFFGKVTEQYLQRLGDRIPVDMPTLDAAGATTRTEQASKPKHMATVHTSILEPDSQGKFVATDYDGKENTFTLRQGRQRQIRINIIHNSARSLDLKEINFISLRGPHNGDKQAVIRLSPMEQDVSSQDDNRLSAEQPVYRGNGAGSLGITCKLEDLPGMEKKTPSGEYITCQLSFQVRFTNHRVPALFVQTLRLRVTGSEARRRSLIMDYLRPSATAAHSSRTFEIQTPSEESASLTTSRMAILAAYLEQRKRQYLVADVQAAAARIHTLGEAPPSNKTQEDLLPRAVEAWRSTLCQRVREVALCPNIISSANPCVCA